MGEWLCFAVAHTRLARTFGKRFGDNAYAMEELVAELSAAFLVRPLELTPKLLEDHARYLDYWLTVLKADKRVIDQTKQAPCRRSSNR